MTSCPAVALRPSAARLGCLARVLPRYIKILNGISCARAVFRWTHDDVKMTALSIAPRGGPGKLINPDASMAAVSAFSQGCRLEREMEEEEEEKKNEK